MLIDKERCKGCSLCVGSCKKKLLMIDKNTLNSKGYSPVTITNSSECTNCTMCAIICPDCAVSCIVS